MRVKDIDEFRSPRRRPWLLLIVLAAATVGMIYYLFLRGGNKTDSPDSTGDGPVGEGLVADPQDPDGPAPALPSADLSDALQRAKFLEESEDLAGARRAYLAILDQVVTGQVRAEIEERLGRVNIRLATTPMAMAEKVDYIVQQGDSVQRIARKFGTTIELVQVGNNLQNPNLIKTGDRFRVLKGEFSIEVSKSRRDLILSLNKRFFKRYAVGTGKYGKTPVGTFSISDKQKTPVWWRPDGKQIPYGDPENILGSRWMAIRATGDTPDVRSYGIHGTADESSIGKAESAGCIRLRNRDVEELFMLVPAKTPVVITE
jgi:lipoprotein-anchoring transpeptidase ErfK/SrfK